MTTNIEIPKGYKLYDGPKDGRFLKGGRYFHNCLEKWTQEAKEGDSKGTRANTTHTYIIPDDSPAIPWSLPAPPAGMSWHREDWTKEMLEDGERPLLAKEVMEPGDYVSWVNPPFWRFVAGFEGRNTSVIAGQHARAKTRRPLPTTLSEPADPYAELKAAHAAGKTIEYRTLASEKWVTRDDPSWCAEPDRYRIKPEPKPSPSDDGWIPWNGGECPVDGDAIVEWKCRSGSIATVTNGRDYKAGNRYWKHLNSGPDIIAYRVISQPEPEKPWTLPDPPEGRQWHRTDGWKKEYLDGGWRPLMADEKCEEGDEFNAFGRGLFVPIERGTVQGTTFLKHNSHCRTKRPLPSVQQAPTQPPPGMRILAKEECDGRWIKGGKYWSSDKWKDRPAGRNEPAGEIGCAACKYQPIAVPIAVPITEPEPVKEEPANTTKTIREWLETLPEPYRSEALRNTGDDRFSIKHPTLWGALTNAFVWCLTSQRHDYWHSIAKGLDPKTNRPFGTTQEDDWLPEKGKPYEMLHRGSAKWERWEEAENDAQFYKEMIQRGVKYRPVKSDLPKPEEPATRRPHHLGTGFIYADLRTQDPLWVTDNTITSTNPEQTENNNNMNTSATITSLPELPPVGSKWAYRQDKHNSSKIGTVIASGHSGVSIMTGKESSETLSPEEWASLFAKTRIYSKRELRQQDKTQKERHKGIIACASGSDSTKPPFSLKRWAMRKAWGITKFASLYGIGVITAPITGPLIKAGFMSAGAVIWSVVSRLVQQ